MGGTPPTTTAGMLLVEMERIQNEAEESYQTPITVLTTKASKGDVVIEVTDPDRYQIGKYIVIQESLIYLVEGKGSLILERPLCRDFLAGTQSGH